MTLTLVFFTAFIVLATLLPLWRVLPYTPLWPKEVKSAATGDSARVITIMTSNVLTPNRNAGALIALVKQHQPDVLVILESDQWWEDQLA